MRWINLNFSFSNLIVLNLSLVRVELWHFWQKSNQSKVRVSGFDAHRKPAGHWVRCVIGLVDSGTRFMRTVVPEFVGLPLQKDCLFRSCYLHKIMNSPDNLVLVSMGNLLLFICKKPDIVGYLVYHEFSMVCLLLLSRSWKTQMFFNSTMNHIKYNLH